jgi:hypothetical protein
MVDSDISALGNWPDMGRYFLQMFKDLLAELTTKNAHGESSIASGSGYKDITHGLGVAPTGITITPEDGFDAPWEVPRASIGTSTFRVQFKGDVESTTTAYFLWEAKE